MGCARNLLTFELSNYDDVIAAGLQSAPQLKKLIAVEGNPSADRAIILRGERTCNASAFFERVAGYMVVPAIIHVDVRQALSRLLVHLDFKRLELFN
jgi:hypothetical protein